MRPRPETPEEAARWIASAAAVRERIEPLDLSGLNRLLEHFPEEMTATAQAGLTLQAFQDQLRRRGQWLPLDPPFPERLTLGELLSNNLSGPRRFGRGTARDYVIGIKAALANGQLIKAGGKVVKNVAGYDLCKLFIGARGTLGVIVEATFKLRPLPEAEEILTAETASWEELETARARLLASRADPVILDAHSLDGKVPFTITAGFAGASEDVEAQTETARALGFQRPGTLDYENAFWSGEPPEKASVLPSRTVETLRRIGPAAFVARLGNGVIHYRGGVSQPSAAMPSNLMRRVKQAFDPAHVFPAWQP